MPTKRTDATTLMIEEFNLKDAGNERSIKEVIDDWKHDIDTNSYGNDKEQMVQGLYNDFQSEWNEGEAMVRAETFLEENCSLEIIKAIEDWYEYVEWEFGDDLGKKTLITKLDICYYFQAEQELKKMLEWEEMDLDFWG